MDRLLKHKRNLTSEEGFTLIELMIVVVIIGILAAISVPIFANQQKEAIKAGMKNDVRNLQTTVATYLVKNPTATSLQWRFENGAQQPNKTLNGDTNWVALTQGFNTSDPNTIMIIRDHYGSANDAPATWQNYYVVAANNRVGNGGYYYYYFNASTGTYAEQG